MTGIGTWEPDTGQIALDRALFERLLGCASQLEEPTLGLTPDEVNRYATLMRRPRAEWSDAARLLDDEALVALARFLTVAEERLPNWEAGAQSPVIALAAELRRRGRWPKPLTAWIKSHSRNRFLPWGSLADRL